MQSRLYRLEQLPRALRWESICALLASIDRSTPMGMRDYAMPCKYINIKNCKC
jgi:site-specific recombinase XerC